jgi:hypothetical protein
LSRNLCRSTFVAQPLSLNLCRSTFVAQPLSLNLCRSTFVAQPLSLNLPINLIILLLVLDEPLQDDQSASFGFGKFFVAHPLSLIFVDRELAGSRS